jgi:hypothetical protein
MISLERLFTLVHSLTKSEKRYFKLSSELQSGAKDYLLLFNVLDNYEIFNKELEKQIRNTFPGSKIEPARKHLYKVIMRSLRLYEGEKNIEIKLMNLLQDSRILFSKGLIDLSLSQLNKIKALAKKQEKFIFQILAAKQEVQYLMRRQFIGIDESDLIKKQELIRNLLEQQLQASAHSSLYEVLLLRFWDVGYARNSRDVLKLNDLILEEHQILISHQYKSFESKQLHLNFQSTYFSMSGESNESLKVYYELEKLFLDNKSLWEYNPLYYIHIIDGILNDLRLEENYKDMDYFLDSLRSIKTPSKSLKILVKYKIYLHQLNRMIDEKHIDRAVILAKEVASSFNSEVNLIPIKMRSWTLFVLARTFYAAGDYQLAIKYLNRILNNPLGVRKNYLMVLCNLMYLQIETLRGRFDHLEYVSRSVERKFRDQHKLFEIERLILKIVKRKTTYKSIDDLTDDLNKLSNNPFNRGIIRDLLLENWIVNIANNIKLS